MREARAAARAAVVDHQSYRSIRSSYPLVTRSCWRSRRAVRCSLYRWAPTPCALDGGDGPCAQVMTRRTWLVTVVAAKRADARPRDPDRGHEQRRLLRARSRAAPRRARLTSAGSSTGSASCARRSSVKNGSSSVAGAKPEQLRDAIEVPGQDVGVVVEADASGNALRRCSSSSRALWIRHSSTGSSTGSFGRPARDRATRAGCLNTPTNSRSGTSWSQPSSVSSVRGSLNPQSGRSACSPRMARARSTWSGPHSTAAGGARHDPPLCWRMSSFSRTTSGFSRLPRRLYVIVRAVARRGTGRAAEASRPAHWSRCDACRAPRSRGPGGPPARSRPVRSFVSLSRRPSWRPRPPSRSAGRPCAASAPHARSRAAGSGTCPRTAA